MDRLQGFGNAAQGFGKSISSSFSPFAARTTQFVRESLGQADEKTELPPEYIDLEKRVDALKVAHQKMLAVTSQYTNEAYDYPPNIRESVNDLGRTVTEKISLLSTASTPKEAAAALTAPPAAKPQPKTFNHAIARAALASSQVLHEANTGTGPNSISTEATSGTVKEDPLATALEKYAVAEEKVGEARLQQDTHIQQKFLSGFSTTLNSQLGQASKARRNVENARLGLDASKVKQRASGSHRGMNPDVDSMVPTAESTKEVEQKEDEFVATVEEAEQVMKNVLDTPEPLRNLSELIAAQMEYYKKAYEILAELAPAVDQLQEEQEQEYRQSRGTA